MTSLTKKISIINFYVKHFQVFYVYYFKFFLQILQVSHTRISLDGGICQFFISYVFCLTNNWRKTEVEHFVSLILHD